MDFHESIYTLCIKWTLHDCQWQWQTHKNKRKKENNENV